MLSNAPNPRPMVSISVRPKAKTSSSKIKRNCWKLKCSQNGGGSWTSGVLKEANGRKDQVLDPDGLLKVQEEVNLVLKKFMAPKHQHRQYKDQGKVWNANVQAVTAWVQRSQCARRGLLQVLCFTYSSSKILIYQDISPNKMGKKTRVRNGLGNVGISRYITVDVFLTLIPVLAALSSPH